MEKTKNKTTLKDTFYRYRKLYKGVYIATAGPTSRKVIAQAFDYKTLEEILKKKGLNNRSLAIRYLEPKGAICAYRVSLQS